MTSLLVLADTRGTIADYVQALVTVGFVLVLAYVVMSIVFAAGVRVPYNRALNAVFEFLRQVVEPYLNIFRRFLPNFGPFDLSPMVATLVLIVVGQIVVALIRG